MPRDTFTKSLLGPDTYKKIKETPVLVVGAGGIGCELLKNLVLVGFGNIEIIDLDTIDLSNLNRQFLFRKPDISKSKALVAAASARHFNPSSGINIHARHGNVKDAQNDLEWIKGFGLVMNALDNRDARSHVNRLCQAAGVPLIESGTAGYLGQVTQHLRDQTECFDCQPKQVTQKTYPVCTLRATPSEPIHCIVWAKSYLFGKLFGEDDEEGDTEELDKAAAEGENADEIENLKKEAAAFREVRQNMGEEDGPRRVFNKVFKEDIERLLAMDDLWKIAGRIKPKALDFDGIMDDSFVSPPLRPSTSATAKPEEPIANAAKDANTANGSKNEQINGSSVNGGSTNGGDSGVLRDQKELGLKETLQLFVDSCRRLSNRAISTPNVPLAFDKDDDDTLDFVLATSNLRSCAYGILQKTRFQVKEMAGNIIPAIATTNAIVAGYVVMAAIRLLTISSNGISGSKSLEQGQNSLAGVYLSTKVNRPLGHYPPNPPNKYCQICRDTYIPLKANLAKLTLRSFVDDVVKGWMEKGIKKGNGVNVHDDSQGNGNLDDEDNEEVDYGWAIQDGPRLLADPDFEDNYEKTLEEMKVQRGGIINVTDEDGKFRPIHFCICEMDPDSDNAYVLPDQIPDIPLAPPKPVERAPSPEIEIILPTDIPASTSKKRTADEMEDAQDNKRRKVQVVQDDDDDFEIQ